MELTGKIGLVRFGVLWQGGSEVALGAVEGGSKRENFNLQDQSTGVWMYTEPC